MAFSEGRRSLRVYLTGDTRGLEKSLARAEYKLKRFNAGAGGSAARGLGAGGLLGFSRGGVAAAGAAAFAIGLRKTIDASKEAEVVLGQTSIAVRNAGIDWQLNAKRIDAAATSISKASAFDDEAVLQSFSVFVRGQKDVEKSITLAGLAADVARGRYTDLESATQLVNKAAMGQIGALRRAGIQIDKNATSTEALAALQRAYGGAAKKYGDEAAGATDRLKVSFENLAETLGRSFTPAVKDGSNWLSSMVDWTDKALKKSQAWYEKLLEIERKLGVPGIRAATADPTLTEGAQNAPDNRATRPGTEPGPKSKGTTMRRTKVELRNQWFDDKIGRRIDRAQDLAPAAQIAALKGIRADLWEQIKKTKDATRKLNLQDLAVQITREINGILEDQARAAADARREAQQRTKDRIAKALAAATDFAEGLKKGALALLDRKQGKVDWQRAITDAKEQLRVAKLIGDPLAIRDANRAIADAQLARDRWWLEGAKVKPVNANTATIIINGMTVNGVNNVKELMDAINKAAKRNTGQQRGKTSGNPMHR